MFFPFIRVSSDSRPFAPIRPLPLLQHPEQLEEHDQMVLPNAWVHIGNPEDPKVSFLVPALLDSGSSVSYISKNLTDWLHIDVAKCRKSVDETGSTIQTTHGFCDVFTQGRESHMPKYLLPTTILENPIPLVDRDGAIKTTRPAIILGIAHVIQLTSGPWRWGTNERRIWPTKMGNFIMG